MSNGSIYLPSNTKWVFPMSVPLVELDEKIITDTGEVVYRHSGLVRKIQNDQPLAGVRVITSQDVMRLGECGVIPWWPTEPETIPPHRFEWNIPDEFKTLDWVEYVLIRFSETGLTGPQYETRLNDEIALVVARQMEPFFRAIIYVVETMREANLLLGVGRGSACASFLLFLIGVHRVDPVQYEIPMEEFFKS